MAEISRRTLLSRTALIAGIGAGAVLGLTRTVHHKVAVPPPPAPDELVSALGRQRALLAGYDTVGVSNGAALPGLRADVAAHGAALSGLLELYPGWRLAQSGGSVNAQPSTSGSATPASPDSIAALAAASKSDAAALVTAAVHWSTSDEHAADVIAVLGSIAACLNVHAEVLS